MKTLKLPTYFISHGGGPWPYMKEEDSEFGGSTFSKLEASLQDIPRQIEKLGVTPKAVLMISGHWEENDFGVMSNPHPPMVYDYFGFPAYTYQIRYEAPGSPTLAARVQDLLGARGLAAHADPKQGFDHGAFAPLYVMYPNANVPVVQISIRKDYSPEAHFELGRAIASLREEAVLIVGSGLSYHNLRKFGPEAQKPSKDFDDWLSNVLLNQDPESRLRSLSQWSNAPSARIAHPREDHLIPLMTALGAAENEKAERFYHEENFFGGITVSSFRFG